MRFSSYFIYIMLFLFASSSCVKNIDFDQADNFTTEPVVKLALVNFTAIQTDFLDPLNNEINQITDTSNFTIFDNSTVQNDLQKVEIDIKASNEFNRTLRVDFVFLDINGNITYQIPALTIPVNTTGFRHQEVIEIATNQPFLQSSQIRSTLILLPSGDGTTINPNEPKKLDFQSGGTFYLKID